MENLDLMIVLAQVANFLILFLIFKKFLGDKLNKSIFHKRELLKKLETAEEEYRKTLEKAYVEKDKILKAARKDANDLYKEMSSIARQTENDIIAKAEKRADMIIAWGERQIEKDRLEMIAWVKSHIIDLTVKLNSKLFKDEKVDKDFIKKELNTLT